MGKKQQTEKHPEVEFELRECPMSGGALSVEDVPDEFKDAESEDSGFLPSPQWERPGDFKIGTFIQTRKNVGKNKQLLHEFANDKDGAHPDFAVWGSTIINKFMTEKKVSVGDRLMITYMGTAPTKRGKSPVKKFDIKLVRASGARKASKRK